MYNPFLPFQSLTNHYSWGCLGRGKDAETLLHRLENSSTKIHILSGAIGSGKSSFLQAVLSPELCSLDYRVCFRQSTPFDSVQTLTGFLTRQFSLEAIDEDHEEEITSSQRIGSIAESSNVEINQRIVSASVQMNFKSQEIDNLNSSLLRSLLRVEKGRKYILIYDQIENLLENIPKNVFEEIFFALNLCTFEPKLNFQIIISVRDTFLYRLVSYINHIPNLLSGLYVLENFSKSVSNEIIKTYLERGSVTFSDGLISAILGDLDNGSGVSPLEIHTACFEVAQLAVSNNRKATVGDYKKLGCLEGILKNYLETRLKAFPKYQQKELIKILALVAGNSSTAKSIDVKILSNNLPAYSIHYIQELLDTLSGIQLIHRISNHAYAVLHDAMVDVIRDNYSRYIRWEEINVLLDEGVARWSKFDIVFDSAQIDIVIATITIDKLLLTHIEIIFLIQSLFHQDVLHTTTIQSIQLLVNILQDIDEDLVIEVLELHARKHKRSFFLIRELFVLVSLDKLKAWEKVSQSLPNNILYDKSGTVNVYFLLKMSLPKTAKTEILKSLDDSNLPASFREQILRYLMEEPNLSILPYIQSMLSDSNPVLRTASLRALGMLKGEDQTRQDAAIQCVDDPDILVKLQAISVLGSIRLSQSKSLLKNLLKDVNPQVRRRSVYAISNYCEEDLYDEISRLADDSDPLVREAVFEVLGETESNRYFSVLTQGIRDEVSYVRESSCYALGRLNDSTVGQYISSLLSDPFSNVREAAMRSIDRIQAVAAKHDLIKQVDNGNEASRLEAIRKLSSVSGEDIDDMFLALLSDPNQEIRRASIQNLAARKTFRAAPRLISLLDTEIGHALCDVIVALQSIGSSDAILPISRLIQSPDEDIRERCVYALAELGGEIAVGALVTALNDESRITRVRAVFGLGRLRAKAVRHIIDNIDSSRDDELRYAIEFYLAEISRGNES
jgi:HEAT repeat protein